MNYEEGTCSHRLSYMTEKGRSMGLGTVEILISLSSVCLLVDFQLILLPVWRVQPKTHLSNIRYTKTLTCKINTIWARLYSRKRGRKDFTTRCLIMYCMLFDCSKYLELSPSLNIQFRSSRFSFNWFARNHPPSWNSPIKIGIIDNSQNMYKSRHFVSL